MLINKKMIIGILLVAISTLLFFIGNKGNRSHLMTRKEIDLYYLFGLMVFVAGTYFVMKGKKQQLKERENNTN